MNSKYITFSLLLVLPAFYFNCRIIKNKKEIPFRIKDAFYQTWVASKQTGTDIIIQIDHIQENIRFDSIIFRGIQLPVFTHEKDGIVTLKSILSFDMKTFHIEKKIVDKPDQLLYEHDGTKHSCDLKNMRRVNTKFN
jgi:hypothetical protein